MSENYVWKTSFNYICYTKNKSGKRQLMWTCNVVNGKD